MKTRLLLFFVFTLSLLSFKTYADDTASVKLGSFDGAKYSIKIGTEDVQKFLDEAADMLEFSARVDSFYIDDPDPKDEKAVAYLTIDASKSGGGKAGLYFYLIKEINGEGGTDYFVNQSYQYASKAAQCQSQEQCEGCKKVREHWYSAATGCNCTGEQGWCQFTSGDTWGTILGIVGVLVSIIPLL